MSEPIYQRMEHDLERGWSAFERHLHHAPYHDPDTTATPAPEAPDMSLLDTVENEIHALADHARKIEQEVLPAAISGAKDVEQLAASNVGQALLGAAHVPSSAVDDLLLPVIRWLSDAYAPETATPAPVAADPVVGDPAMGQQPEPAPEPQPAAA